MGYFVQVSTEAGEPIFQAVKNYPDVSFASSALFHALVTASLNEGFVPSVLRAQDATIALAVHGTAGCRVSIAVVTSEFSAGQTQEVEAQLQWRLNVIYRGVLLAAGGEMLRQQPKEPLRRLLGQRLQPMVRRLMAEEVAVAAPDVHEGVPRLGLTCRGAAVEWLPRVPAAESALLRLVGSLPLGGGAVLAGSAAMGQTMTVVSWQGRALAATQAWRRLPGVDRALLLSLADELGPSTFERPTRSWALEELGGIALPSAWAAAAHLGSPDADGACLVPIGAFAADPGGSQGSSALTPGGYRMVSIRLYPASGEVARWMGRGCEVDGEVGANGASEAPAPTGADVGRVWEEELSLIFSLIEPEEGGAPGRPKLTAADLQESADLCGDSLQDFWSFNQASWGERLLSSAGRKLAAVLLLDEASQDVVTAPTPWRLTPGLPWHSLERRRHADALRRLLYWLRALPPLDACRDRTYVYSDGYAVGGIRSEDGLQCWGIMEWKVSGNGAADGAEGGRRVLDAVATALQHASRVSCLQDAFGEQL